MRRSAKTRGSKDADYVDCKWLMVKIMAIESHIGPIVMVDNNQNDLMKVIKNCLLNNDMVCLRDVVIKLTKMNPSNGLLIEKAVSKLRDDQVILALAMVMKDNFGIPLTMEEQIDVEFLRFPLFPKVKVNWPPDTASADIQAAIPLVKLDLEAAATILREGYLGQEIDTEAWLRTGRSLSRLSRIWKKKPDPAGVAYAHALEMDSTNKEAWNALAAYLSDRDFDAASAAQQNFIGNDLLTKKQIKQLGKFLIQHGAPLLAQKILGPLKL